MMKNLVNLNEFELNRDNVKAILENNSEFRNSLESDYFDSEVYYYTTELLDRIDGINWRIDFGSVEIWKGFSSNILDIVKSILDIDYFFINDTDILLQKLEVFYNALYTCPQYGNQYDRLEERTEQLLEILFTKIEDSIKSSLDYIDDIENLTDWYIDSGYDESLTWSGMYINPKTFELYELKHL